MGNWARRQRRLATKLAVGGLAAAALPVAVATPAGASYEADDVEDVTISFVRNGQTVTCRVRGRTDYEFPVGDTDSARIVSLTIVSNDPGCQDAVYQASLSGAYETAPDSGEFVRFSAAGAPATSTAPGEFGVLKELVVPGPTGHINVTHLMRFRCDNPPAGATFCGVTATTNPK